MPRFIESTELREWVRENLRKAIFQKAHALATQTGCEIMVKIHDVTDIENCQFYSTRNLKRIYQSSKLRQPGETQVSGETGLPLRDKCIQSCVPEEESSEQVEGGFQQMEEGMEVNAATTQTQGENQFETSNADDTNSQVVVKTEVDDTEQVEAPHPELMVKDVPTSGLPGAGSPTISRLQPLMFSTAQKRLPYQCGICQKTFRSLQVLQKHNLTFHSRPKLQRQMSRGRGRGRGKGHARHGHGSQYFRNQESQEHLEPKGYYCVMCNQSFHTQDILQDHVTQVHYAAMGPSDQQQQSSSQVESNDHPPDPTQPLPAAPLKPEDGSTPGASTSTLNLDGTPMLMDSTATLDASQSSPTFDMSHGSESAFDVSTASTSSSPMGWFSPGRRRGAKVDMKGLGVTKPWNWQRHHTIVKTNNVNQYIMEAILLTPGPVSTRTAVNTAGPRFLRGSISNQQFEHAAFALQNLNLGHLINSAKVAGTSGTQVFIKKAPPAAVEQLTQQGLCTVDEYRIRYATKAPKCISQKLCSDLVAGGFIAADLFHGRL